LALWAKVSILKSMPCDCNNLTPFMAPSDIDCHLYLHDTHHGCPGIIHNLPNQEIILFEESARIVIRTHAVGLKHVLDMFVRALIFFDKKTAFSKNSCVGYSTYTNGAEIIYWGSMSRSLFRILIKHPGKHVFGQVVVCQQAGRVLFCDRPGRIDYKSRTSLLNQFDKYVRHLRIELRTSTI